MRQRGFEDEEISFFQKVNHSINQIFQPTGLAANQFIPLIHYLAFAAKGLGIERNVEWFQLLHFQALANAFDPYPTAGQDRAVSGFDVEHIAGRLVVEKNN